MFSQELWYDVEPGRERLTHLVFVDGRLVDTWHEPVTGTRWEGVAARFDRAALPPPSPPPPPHQLVQAWLSDICGGPMAVDALTDAPLTDNGIDLPTEYAEQAGRRRMEDTAELLDTVAAQWFDAEASFAFRRALLALWSAEPEIVTRAASPAQVAGGICWAVGRANGLLSPQGALRVVRIQEALALRSPISGFGGTVRDTLRGFRTRAAERHGRPPGVPDLMALGRSDVLLANTRVRLIRLRDRARAAAASDP